MAESLGVGWLLMAVFAVGGMAGIVLVALMVISGAHSAREEQQDWIE